MKRKQLAALFACNLIPVIVGNALLALLPVYAVRLGADQVTTGIYLSLSFLALTIGALGGGWFSARFQRRKEAIFVGACISLPVVYLMGQVNSVALLTLFTSIAWFLGGQNGTMVNILTAMSANPRERGRIFGIIGITGSLGQVIGGFASGALVDRWGYPALFIFTSVIYIVPIIASRFLEDHRIEQKPSSAPVVGGMMSTAVWLLLAASIVAPLASFTAGLTRPVMMNGLGFDPRSITNAIAVSGLVTLPMPLLVGWLSDRIGRKQLLMGSYGLASIGALVLVSALHLPQFWLSAVLFALSGSAISAGYAYVTDLVSPQNLSTALARFSSTGFISGVIGYAASGLVIQQLGLQTTLMLAALFPVVAILMLANVRPPMRVAQA